MAKKKYVIVTRMEYVSDTIEAENAEKAIENFAFDMDTDMNKYFMVVEEKDLERFIAERNDKIHEKVVTDYMQEELENEYDLPEEDAVTYAKLAYERYSEGNGETEGECIEWAANEYYEDKDEEDD